MVYDMQYHTLDPDMDTTRHVQDVLVQKATNCSGYSGNVSLPEIHLDCELECLCHGVGSDVCIGVGNLFK